MNVLLQSIFAGKWREGKKKGKAHKRRFRNPARRKEKGKKGEGWSILFLRSPAVRLLYLWSLRPEEGKKKEVAWTTNSEWGKRRGKKKEVPSCVTSNQIVNSLYEWKLVKSYRVSKEKKKKEEKRRAAILLDGKP